MLAEVAQTFGDFACARWIWRVVFGGLLGSAGIEPLRRSASPVHVALWRAMAKVVQVTRHVQGLLRLRRQPVLGLRNAVAYVLGVLPAAGGAGGAALGLMLLLVTSMSALPLRCRASRTSMDELRHAFDPRKAPFSLRSRGARMPIGRRSGAGQTPLGRRSGERPICRRTTHAVQAIARGASARARARLVAAVGKGMCRGRRVACGAGANARLAATPLPGQAPPEELLLPGRGLHWALTHGPLAPARWQLPGVTGP